LRKKIIFISSLIILLLLTVNILFREGLFSEFLKKFLVSRLEQELHASVQISKVRLNLFPPLLSADDLAIKEKKESPLPVIKANHLAISFSPLSLVAQYLVIHKIQIIDPEIQLIWEETGKSNFDFLIGNTTPGKKLPFIIQKLVLVNSSLNIDQKSKGIHAVIPSLELKVEADPAMANFQVNGSTKEIFYQAGKENNGSLLNSEWKLGIGPNSIEIKKLNAASKEGSLMAKGLLNLVSHEGEFPFQLDADFHLTPKKKKLIIDGLSGHGQLVGGFNPEKSISGSMKISQIVLETGKTSQKIGDFKCRFSYDRKRLRADRITSDLFGATLEGSFTVTGEDNSMMIETEYSIRRLVLNRLSFLSSSPFKKYLEGRILDAGGSFKIRNLDLKEIESSGHIHLIKTGETKTDPKNPFLDNLTASLYSAESDYQYVSSGLTFQNASLKAGSANIQGNGHIQTDGTIHSFFSVQTEKGGEILTWLGYPQWSGKGEISGEIQGNLSAPILLGKGSVKDVFFENHPLGAGTSDFGYSNRELQFSSAKISKGTGTYTGEGSVHWDSFEKFTYNVSAHAFQGIPRDIISVFIDDFPLDTQGSGPVDISGDEKSILVAGNIELEKGTLYGETFDKGDVKFEVTEKEIVFQDTTLTRGDSTIAGNGNISFQGSYSGDIRVDNFHLDDISIISKNFPSLTGSFKGNLHGEGSLDHPIIKLTGSLPEVVYQNQTLRDGTVEIFLQDKDLQTVIKFKEHPVQITGSITMARPFLSKFSVEGEQIPVIPLLATTSGFGLTSLKGTVSGKLEIEGPLTDLQQLNYSAYLNRLEADLAGYPVSNQGDMIFQLRNGSLNIESFHLKGEGTSLSITGGLQLSKQFNLFVTGEADLSLLKAFSKEITSGQGKAYLALNIYDAWSDPKFQGGLTIQEGQIRTTFFPQPFHISSLGLFFNERQVLLESLEAALGEGMLHVTGKIDINRFKMGHFGLIVETRESRFTFFPGWASTVSGALIYQGDLSYQTLQGEMVLSNGLYNKKFDLKPLIKKLTEIRENQRQPIPVIGNTRLNIHLSGEDNLRVTNNVARLPFTADLTLKGTVDHPVLVGRMQSDSGFIIFYNRTFTVSSVSVDFIDPENIKPLIDLKAGIQIVGKDNTKYQIELGLSGTLEEFNRTLTADDPTLTETDILSLILAGKKATEVATDPASQQQIGGSFVPFVIESPFEGLLEDLTGVNRLSIEPVSTGFRSTSGGGPRVTMEEHLLNDKLLLNYSYIMNPSQDQRIQMDYLLNRHFYLQGIRNEDGTLGGNLKFRFEFK
jgi:autotransporter translocation and assembly factor TamB